MFFKVIGMYDRLLRVNVVVPCPSPHGHVPPSQLLETGEPPTVAGMKMKKIFILKILNFLINSTEFYSHKSKIF